MPGHITRMITAVLLTALLVTPALANNRSTENQPPAEEEEAALATECAEVQAIADQSWTLYDSNPRPMPFRLLPLILSKGEEIGEISRGQEFTICGRVNKSTWNQRSVWLRVRVEDGNNDTSGFGWITMPPHEADAARFIAAPGPPAPARDNFPEGQTNPEMRHTNNSRGCRGTQKTADRGWLLYDSDPRPFPLLPLILSEVDVIGGISAGQQFTICGRVDRSTWNRRTAWLQVGVDDGNNDPNLASGWINMSREEADRLDSWIPKP